LGVRLALHPGHDARAERGSLLLRILGGQAGRGDARLRAVLFAAAVLAFSHGASFRLVLAVKSSPPAQRRWSASPGATPGPGTAHRRCPSSPRCRPGGTAPAAGTG